MGIACPLAGRRAWEQGVRRSRRGVAVGIILVLVSACGGDGVSESTVDVPDPTADAVDDTAQSESQVTDAETETETDADADGVGDDEDNCPNDHNPDQRDICTDDPGAPGGCPGASVFLVRDDSVTRPLLVVDAPSCSEGIPHVLPPTRPGTKIVAVVGDRTYVLIDEESADLPAGGVEIEGAVVDMSAPPESGSIAEAELAEVISTAVSSGDAGTVAAALTPEAESYVSPTIWSQVVALNPDLVAGDEVVVDGGGVIAP